MFASAASGEFGRERTIRVYREQQPVGPSRDRPFPSVPSTYLRRNILACPRPLHPENLTGRASQEVFVELIYHLLAFLCLTRAQKELVISFSE